MISCGVVFVGGAMAVMVLGYASGVGVVINNMILG